MEAGLPQDAPARPRPGSGSGLRRLTGVRSRVRARVLVVDDREETREMYAWCMRAAGWQVEEAGSGEEALVAAYDFQPDVILLDLTLPGMSGLQVARRLMQDEMMRNVQVVACTGAERAAAEPLAREAGCAAFVAKPCVPEDMRALLEKLVSLEDG